MSAFPLTLRHRVMIQAPTPGQDAAGQPIPVSWVDHRPAWANIRNTGGMESIRAGASTSAVQASIRLRYCRDLTAAMQVVHGAMKYKILAVLPDEDRRQHVDLVCEVIQ